MELKITLNMKTKFDLEAYGIADDVAYVKIVEHEPKPYILFCTETVELPDFCLYGDALEEFAVTILKMMGSKKLAPETP